MLGLLLPWSAAARLIAHLEDEAAYLRARVDNLHAQNQNLMGLVLKGVGGDVFIESSRGVRKPTDPPPDALAKLCARFDTDGHKVWTDAHRARARGRTWDDILSDLTRQMPPEPELGELEEVGANA